MTVLISSVRRQKSSQSLTALSTRAPFNVDMHDTQVSTITHAQHLCPALGRMCRQL